MHFIPLKKELSNYSKMFCFCSSALLHLSFYSNSVNFVKGGEGGARTFLGAGYPSYATGRKIPLHQQKFLVVSVLSNSPWLPRNFKIGPK